MRFILEKKTLNYLTVIFLGFLVYQAYKKEKEANAPNPNREAFIERFSNNDELLDRTKNKVKIDPEKKYSDYSLTEKFVYHIYKNEIDNAHEILNKRKEMNNPPRPMPQITQVKPARGVIVGDKLQITYKIKGDPKKNEYKKTFIIGKDKEFSKNTQFYLIGMVEGASRDININRKEINPKAKDEFIDIEVKLIKIN